jgi:hypothetical protein
LLRNRCTKSAARPVVRLYSRPLDADQIAALMTRSEYLSA